MPRRPLCLLALTLALLQPAWAQTQVWSDAPRTQRWSDVPAPPPAAPAAPRTGQWSDHHALPAPGGTAGRTTQWSTPTHTQRRSDADIQRQVDAISRDAERRARAGQGGLNGAPAASQMPEQAWRNHMDRSRAQDQFQREQDEYYRRQREFNAR